MIRFLLSQARSLLYRKQQSILSAATVIMVTVFMSRILGLFRDRLLATYFPVGQLDVYFAAFRLPNLLFELLVMGALSTAFIPVFTKYLIKNSQSDAFETARSTINLSIVVTFLVLIPLLIFTRQLSYILVPGFSDADRALMISFTRIMLLGQLLPLIIGNFVTGMLQSLQRFLLPALAPVIYNVGIILGLLLLSKPFGLYAPVFGVVIGAILYLLIQIPLLLKLGYTHRFTIDMQHRGMREIGRLMLPRTFGMAVSQIDTTVDLILASYLGQGSITIFYFAQHLQQLPLGLFGATFAQAALPSLSAEAANKNLSGFKIVFLASLHQTFFFLLPTSMILMVLRTPIVRLVFGAARFDWHSTVLTGMTLSFFAVSLAAQAVVQLFARGFYALHDTKTPVAIGIISVAANTALSVWFVSFLHWPVWSLAVSTSIANFINAFLLLVFLHKKVDGFGSSLWLPPLKMIVATLITGVFLYVPIKLLDQLVFDTTQVFELILLTGIAVISGGTVYLFLAWFFNIEEVGTFFALLQKVKRVPRVFFSQSPDLVNDDRPQMS